MGITPPSITKLRAYSATLRRYEPADIASMLQEYEQAAMEAIARQVTGRQVETVPLFAQTYAAMQTQPATYKIADDGVHPHLDSHWDIFGKVRPVFEDMVGRAKEA